MAPKRRASILTDKQRDYLLGNHEPANESEYRSRIRDGLHMSVFDYHLILNEMDLKDIRKAFQERDDRKGDTKMLEDTDSGVDIKHDTNFPREGNVIREFGTALPSLFGVPYLKLHPEEKQANSQEFGWRLELDIEHGIKRALNRMGESVDNVSVDIDIDIGEPLDELVDKDLSELDHDTLGQLRKEGHISNDEFAEAWVAIKEKEKN